MKALPRKHQMTAWPWPDQFLSKVQRLESEEEAFNTPFSLTRLPQEVEEKSRDRGILKERSGEDSEGDTSL